jgi:hypothetical protein
MVAVVWYGMECDLKHENEREEEGSYIRLLCLLVQLYLSGAEECEGSIARLVTKDRPVEYCRRIISDHSLYIPSSVWFRLSCSNPPRRL